VLNTATAGNEENIKVNRKQSGNPPNGLIEIIGQFNLIRVDAGLHDSILKGFTSMFCLQKALMLLHMNYLVWFLSFL